MDAIKDEDDNIRDRFTELQTENRRLVDKARRSKKIMQDRLRTIVTRYGRDKICAVLRIHAKHTLRRSFLKWGLIADLASQMESLKRRKYLLRVKFFKVTRGTF